MHKTLEEIGSRLNSPFFGYFSIAVLAINWEPFFYLIVHNGTALDRIAHFKEGTNLVSLFVFPFILAACYAIFYPWLQYLIIYLVRVPTELNNSLHAQTESNLLVKKKELEIARIELLSVAEAELIDRAKRDAEIEDIDNENVREKLQNELASLREQVNQVSSTALVVDEGTSPSQEQIEILRMMTDDGGNMREPKIISNSKYDRVRTEYYLEDLESIGYVTKSYEMEPINAYVYSLTTKSKKLMVEMGYAK